MLTEESLKKGLRTIFSSRVCMDRLLQYSNAAFGMKEADAAAWAAEQLASEALLEHLNGHMETASEAEGSALFTGDPVSSYGKLSMRRLCRTGERRLAGGHGPDSLDWAWDSVCALDETGEMLCFLEFRGSPGVRCRMTGRILLRPEDSLAAPSAGLLSSFMPDSLAMFRNI